MTELLYSEETDYHMTIKPSACWANWSGDQMISPELPLIHWFKADRHVYNDAPFRQISTLVVDSHSNRTSYIASNPRPIDYLSAHPLVFCLQDKPDDPLV